LKIDIFIENFKNQYNPEIENKLNAVMKLKACAVI
jgi:hypothetical protein